MKSNTTKSASAGLLVAFTASLCCITPVLALFSGIGGVAATFSWMEPFRPHLIGLTVSVLGFAWYQKLKPRKQEEIDCDCEEDGKEPFIQSKAFLGIVTVVASILLAFPSYSNIFYPEVHKSAISTENSINLATLEIEGMTCTGCEEHVNFAIGVLPGVATSSASWEDGRAKVIYDASNMAIDDIVAAVVETGYKVLSYQERPATKSEVEAVTATHSN